MSNVDASPEAQRIAQEKLQRKLQLRNEFLKQRTDPFRHASGEAGTVFDKAFLRYQSLSVNHYEFFRPSGKNLIHGLCLVVIPMLGAGYFIRKSRKEYEEAYRKGEIPYKDRIRHIC